MIDFKVNSNCIRCFQCVKDCPVHIIGLGETGFPFIKKDQEEECIECQHCLAVCPKRAVSILGKDPKNSSDLRSKQIPKLSELELLVEGRRSVRRFQDENVDKKLITRLLSDALHAPTGVNSMQVNFFVVDDKETMQKIRVKVYNKISQCVQKNSLPIGMEFFKEFLKSWQENGHDNIFRKAPHMLLATADGTVAHTPHEDCIIALSYFELLAASESLGTVWCGLAKWALTSVLPEMKSEFGIPENHNIEYIMMFGVPAVKYFRTVQRDTADKIKTITF
ncbi:MAG TPA: nitroreductase [Lentisphaeria bacterium]|nr:MAG: hypothetical protein A2X47_13055 [Lentisphaerae bacterium GWF2_38_69]HBM16018.1 nitroreductase [Lentisphaeria bacterium]